MSSTSLRLVSAAINCLELLPSRKFEVFPSIDWLIKLLIFALRDWLNRRVWSKSSKTRTGIDTWIWVNLTLDRRFIQSTPLLLGICGILTQNKSQQGRNGLLKVYQRQHDGSERFVCIVSIVRTWLFHGPLTYNDWPIIVVLCSIMLVGGVLLRITASTKAVGQGWLGIPYY